MPDRRPLLFAGAALLLGACGDGVQRFDPSACDPIADEGCPGGFHCRLVAGGETECLAPTQPPPDRPCQPGSCPSGSACVTLEGALGCHPVCDPDPASASDCPGGGRCAYRPSRETPWALCAPRCTLGASCPDGLTCTPTAGIDHLVCAAAGPATETQACDEDHRCGAGLACLVAQGVARCHQLCAPEGPNACAQGACVGQIVQVSGVGYCAGG
jgi:hypothetical protein